MLLGQHTAAIEVGLIDFFHAPAIGRETSATSELHVDHIALPAKAQGRHAAQAAVRGHCVNRDKGGAIPIPVAAANIGTLPFSKRRPRHLGLSLTPGREGFRQQTAEQRQHQGGQQGRRGESINARACCSSRGEFGVAGHGAQARKRAKHRDKGRQFMNPPRDTEQRIPSRSGKADRAVQLIKDRQHQGRGSKHEQGRAHGDGNMPGDIARQ